MLLSMTLLLMPDFFSVEAVCLHNSLLCVRINTFLLLFCINRRLISENMTVLPPPVGS